MCELSSNSTQDAVLILFLYFFLIIIFEMTFGMVLTIQGKSAIGLRWVKGEHNMAPTGEEASEWKMKHKKKEK